MRLLLKAVLFLGVIAVAAPAFSQVSIAINIGPPPMRYEEHGYAPDDNSVWINGFWMFNRGRDNYDWSPGRWERRPSPTHYYVAPRYVHRDGHYEYYEGSWKDHGKNWSKGRGHDNGDRGHGDHGDHGDRGHGDNGNGHGKGKGHDKGGKHD